MQIFIPKRKRQLETLIKGIFNILPFVVLLTVSIIFFQSGIEGAKDDYMFIFIKYALLMLDAIAFVIGFKKTMDLLYDVDILKRKQHTIKRDDDEE